MLTVVAVSAEAWSFLGGDRLSKYAKHPAFHWQTTTTEHFTIYYETNTATVPRLDEIRASVELSRSNVLQLIRAQDFPDRIHVFLVDSLPRMKALRGSAGYGGAIAKIRVVFAVVNATNNGCSTHEICHVIASAVWGKPERWLDEGFASYSDERWVRRDVIAARFAAEDRLLPLETLARDFLKHPEELTYIQSSSLVGFVIKRHGLEKFKRIWRGGFERIPKVLGFDATELEREWRASLRSVATKPGDSSPQ